MIQALLTEDICVIRPKVGGNYVKGRFIPGVNDEQLDMKASVQPQTGEKLENPEEGERTRETVVIFVLKELFTAAKSPLKRPDVVVYNSNKYEVTQVDRWKGPLPHFRVVAEKLLDDGEVQ